MKILQLTKKIPFPLKDGESIAIHSIAKGLVCQGAQVHLLTMNTSKHYYKGSLEVEELSHYTTINAVYVDNRVKWGGALYNLFTHQSYHVSRFVSNDYLNKLKDLLEAFSFDIIQLETLYLAPYLPALKKYSKAKIVMRAHNIEFEIWERIWKNSLGWKRWYLYFQINRLKKFELSLLSSFSLWVSISDRDLQKMRELGLSSPAVSVQVPISTSFVYSKEYTSENPLVIGFIGSLDWLPNKEGLDWFLKKVWPEVKRHNLECRLFIAGRNTPNAFFQWSDSHITVLGEVDSSESFFQSIDVLIVPLFSGSGVRIKILEAMAAGLLVITTAVGVEGIPAVHNQSILLADTATEFIEALKSIKANPRKLSEIGDNAKKVTLDNFDPFIISKKLINHYNNLLGI